MAELRSLAVVVLSERVSEQAADDRQVTQFLPAVGH